MDPRVDASLWLDFANPMTNTDETGADMSKPASPARPDDLARREAMDRWIVEDFRRPSTTSIFHPLYQWPSDTQDEYAARCAQFRANAPTDRSTVDAAH